MLANFKCYQMAKELYLETQKLKLNPILKNQLDRASLSIALNLAEGSGCSHMDTDTENLTTASSYPLSRSKL